MKTFLSTVALCAMLGAMPAIAHAQSDDAEATRMAKEHYQAGLQAYQAGHYDEAIKELKKAYLLKRLPALLLNIGATYRKMGELDLALHFYEKYLQEAPPDARDRDEVNKIIADIKIDQQNGGQAASAPPAQAPSEEAPPPRPARAKVKMPREWSHTVIDAAPPDQPIDVQVQMPVMKGVKVWLYYRGTGEANFTPVLMKRHGPEKIGRIPADAVQGKAIQYYIEAKDSGGTVVKSSGSEVSPNIVMIDPSAAPQIASIDQGEEQQAQEGEARETQQGGDEEQPPMPGSVEENPLAPHHPHHAERRSSSTSTYGGVFWGGVAVAAIGVASLAVGFTGLAMAKQKADALSSDSQQAAQNGNMYYFNNDPQAGATDANLQSAGKMWNTVGIAMTTVGGVALVSGVTMMLIDRYALHHDEEQPAHHRPRHRRVDPDEASIQNLYLAPAAGPGYAGVGGGFEF